jgi:hypothetical protein
MKLVYLKHFTAGHSGRRVWGKDRLLPFQLYVCVVLCVGSGVVGLYRIRKTEKEAKDQHKGGRAK